MKLLSISLFAVLLAVPARASVPIFLDPQATPREHYAASRLTTILEYPGFHAPYGARILAGVRSSTVFAEFSALSQFAPSDTEAFQIRRTGDNWLVVGSSPSGVLYGCLELARRAALLNSLPEAIDLTDRPAFRIRGTNLFWMKSGSYNWPVVPEKFPWFFDRALMTRYLDELAGNRYNALFFWNGHPFPYFLGLDRFPEAGMLSPQDLQRNIDYFQWFTAEADRRGIWIVFHFYNIHVSPNFALAHKYEGVKEENAESTPLLADYMRYCVSQFVNTYPNVGLMITAGEALHVNPELYIRDVIIKGLLETAKNPPLIVRQWTIDPNRFRDIVLPSYNNLFTMMKHNTEMLVSPVPDPRNKTWVEFGKNHIVNLHELGDVKPFRWGSPVWIEQAVQNWKSMGISGFHVYPMISWTWPQTLDQAEPSLSVIDRDQIWLQAFGRYGWQPDRPAEEEAIFWKDLLTDRFGSPEAGAAIYNFYVKTGPILPGLQNVVNIFNMNHFPTAVSEEASLNGILHATRWGGVDNYLGRPLDAYTLAAYEQRYGKLSEAERASPPLSVRDSLYGHKRGIQPLPLADLFVAMAEDSLKQLSGAQSSVKLELEEFARFQSDSRCILLLARFFRAKLQAAIEKGRYDESLNLAHYDRMLNSLDRSVQVYRQLTTLTTSAYRQASDLGDWHRWSTALANFEQEAAFYHSQRALTASGADVVYLGLDGPMNDASNAFHWLLEDFRQHQGWSSQSYAFGNSPFSRAKLAVLYDSGSHDFLSYSNQLRTWVEQGGKLLVWNIVPGTRTSPLLEGLAFHPDSSHELPSQIAFENSQHPLLRGLSGKYFDLPTRCSSSGNLLRASDTWSELAYTIVETLNTEQIQWGYQPFGPRWTSTFEDAHKPTLLFRKFGRGEVAVADIGACEILPKPKMSQNKLEEAPPYLVDFSRNAVAWAADRQAP